jgi:hypothetical protein
VGYFSKKNNSKNLQKLAGLKPCTYWIDQMQERISYSTMTIFPPTWPSTTSKKISTSINHEVIESFLVTEPSAQNTKELTPMKQPCQSKKSPDHVIVKKSVGRDQMAGVPV